MKQLICGLSVLIFFGCTGKTAVIDPDKFETPVFALKSPASVSYHVPADRGIAIFEQGHSTSLDYKKKHIRDDLQKISVNLKEIQEIAANKVLNSLFSKTDNYPQQVNITSAIYKFRWMISGTITGQQIRVAFQMYLAAQDQQGNLLYKNSVLVEDYSAPEKILPAVAITPLFMQIDSNRHSQLVGETVAQKVIEIFSVEFEKIAKAYDEKQTP